MLRKKVNELMINDMTIKLRQYTLYKHSKTDPGTPSTFLETQKETSLKTMMETLKV